MAKFADFTPINNSQHMKTVFLLILLLISSSILADNRNSEKIRTVTISTYGMHCTGCEETIETEIKKLGGIKSVKADHVKKSVIVKYDDKKVTLSQVKEAIKSAGYKLSE